MNLKRGLSLLEVMLVIGLFGLLALVSFLILRNSSKIFLTNSGRDRASAQLIKAGQALRRDLDMIRLSSETSAITTVPGSLGGGADSDALIFLSARDPITGQFQTDVDGQPFWMRNIVYYAIVPTDYVEVIGQTTSGGNVAGYEMNCPAKQLIRVEVDENTGNNPADINTCDKLITNVNALLTRPAGVFKADNRKTVATNLLSFRCQQFGSELRVNLRAVSIDEARRAHGFGPSTDYSSGRYTLEQSFSVFSH